MRKEWILLILITIGLISTSFLFWTAWKTTTNKQVGNISQEVLSSKMPADSIQERAWLLLHASPDEHLEENFKTASGSSSDLSTFLADFHKAYALPFIERDSYFQKYMSALGEKFCKNKEADPLGCQSALLVSDILNVKFHPELQRENRSSAEAIAALVYLKKFAILAAKDKIAFTSSEMKRYTADSLAYEALSWNLSQLYMINGDFEKAAETAAAAARTKKSTNQVTLKSELQQTQCEAQALGSCNFKDICQSSYWSEWAQGCHATKAPTATASKAIWLGYWWTTANKSNRTELDEWEKTKPTDFSDIFSKQVYLALDFVISAKSEDPRELLERAQRIPTSSPLWTWAHRQALKEFGSQWAHLVRPSDQKLLANNNLFDYDVKRSVASEGTNQKTK